ncbi:hypothetical protein [Dactylosporangium sp. CA-092794]|uniref:hypothetical protein n=1 Tax=Dactylosporangium sp. CA-092794 TaxID=3239929 RepID=UPI003D925C5B
MTTRFWRRAGVVLAAAVLTLGGSLLSAGPAQAANPPGWDVCAEVDTGSDLCMFNYNPPESWPDGFAPGGSSYRGRCWNAGTGFMPGNNTTSYVVNHSSFTFFIFDGANCTGSVLTAFPNSAFGMPAGWNDKLSSVELCCPIEAVTPAGVVAPASLRP